jgi:hypothetical protein
VALALVVLMDGAYGRDDWFADERGVFRGRPLTAETTATAMRRVVSARLAPRRRHNQEIMAQVRPLRITRVVGLKEVAESREALDRARWRCECCRGDSMLRVVVDLRARLIVLCLSCRLEAGWDPALRDAQPPRSAARAKGR